MIWGVNESISQLSTDTFHQPVHLLATCALHEDGVHRHTWRAIWKRVLARVVEIVVQRGVAVCVRRPDSCLLDGGLRSQGASVVQPKGQQWRQRRMQLMAGVGGVVWWCGAGCECSAVRSSRVN